MKKSDQKNLYKNVNLTLIIGNIVVLAILLYNTTKKLITIGGENTDIVKYNNTISRDDLLMNSEDKDKENKLREQVRIDTADEIFDHCIEFYKTHNGNRFKFVGKKLDSIWGEGEYSVKRYMDHMEHLEDMKVKLEELKKNVLEKRYATDGTGRWEINDNESYARAINSIWTNFQKKINDMLYEYPELTENEIKDLNTYCNNIDKLNNENNDNKYKCNNPCTKSKIWPKKCGFSKERLKYDPNEIEDYDNLEIDH